MRFSADTRVLSDALKIALATCQHPNGRGVCITAVAPDRLVAVSAEPDLQVQLRIEAQVLEPGQVALGQKEFALLHDIVAAAHRSGVSEILADASDKELKLQAGAGKAGRYVLTRLADPAEFPAWPETEAERTMVQASVLQDIGRAICPAAAQPGSVDRQEFTSVHIRITGDKLLAEATDRARVARLSTVLPTAGPDVEFLVSARALKQALRALPSEGLVEAAVGSSVVQWAVPADGTKVAVRRMEGQYPNVDGILPKAYGLSFQTDLEAFRDTCERACCVASGNGHVPVRLEFRPDHVEVKVALPEVGAGEEIVGGSGRLPEGNGDKPLVRSFDGFLLLDGLKGSRAKEVIFEVNSESAWGPGRIRRVGDGESKVEYEYVLMPLTG